MTDFQRNANTATFGIFSVSFALASIALESLGGLPYMLLGSVLCGLTSGALGILSLKRGEVKWVAITALVLGLLVALKAIGVLGIALLFTFG